MELYDAFTQGIKPGGLRSKSEIKLLVCYIICKIDNGISKKQLNDILTGEELANYFEANEALAEVVKTGNVRIEYDGDDEILFPTELGKANIAQLENDLPYSVKETALNAAIETKTILRREQENQISITNHGDGYDVTISIMDNDDKLLSVTLYVADYSQAEYVKEKFLQDPVKMYSTIVALLMA